MHLRLARLRRRLQALRRGSAVEREIDEEMRFHVEMEAAEFERSGVPPAEARRRALVAFGGVGRFREAGLDVRRVRWMEDLGRDLVHAGRSLRRSPAFSLAVIGTLALGIGAVAVIYGVVHAVLLRPLPYPESERLVTVWTRSTDEPKGGVSYPDFLDWRARARELDGLGVMRPISVNLTGLDRPDRLVGVYASASVFRLLGARPALGRLFDDAESEVGTAQPVVVLTHAAWQARFGGDPAILGRTVTLNGAPMTVIGVLGARFEPPYGDADVWIPIALFRSLERDSRTMMVLGRLRAGGSVAAAQQDLAAVAAQLEREHPATNADVGVNLVPLRDDLFGDVRPSLLTLLAAVFGVLLIACFNVANLQLTRAAARHTELSLRAALGAGRGRIVRQLLTESTVLGVVGGALGVLLAAASLGLVRASVPATVFYFGDIALDGPVLAFAAAVTLATAIAFGVAPALGASRAGLGEGLRVRGARSARLGGRFALRDAFVVAQVSLSLVLLLCAGLLVRTLGALASVDPGFDPSGLITMELRLPPVKYPTRERQTAFMERALEEIRRTPGVSDAALARTLPLSGNSAVASYGADGVATLPGVRAPGAFLGTVTPGYFRTLRLPLREGRDFDARDRADTPPVAIVSAALARRGWPNGSALGHRIRVEGDTAWRTIVGVAADAKQTTLAEPLRGMIYTPMSQAPGIFTSVVARTVRPPEEMGAAVRAAIWRVDPDQPVWKIRSMASLVDRALGQPRYTMRLVGAFAALALVLATIGIYGVVAHMVETRTREIGIRLAIGARSGQVLRLVVAHGMRLTALAIVLAVPVALWASRLLRGQLFGVGALDPLTFAAVPAVLAAAALLATFLPARRAVRIEPSVAIRSAE